MKEKREKRVKYLAINERFGWSKSVLTANANEIKEFESYNIKVKDFDELSINSLGFAESIIL
jgi:hypothetical protein